MIIIIIIIIIIITTTIRFYTLTISTMIINMIMIIFINYQV